MKSLNGKELGGEEMNVSEARPGAADRRLGEDEPKIIAAGAVTNPVLLEKRLVNVTAKKAWAFPCSKIKPF